MWGTVQRDRHAKRRIVARYKSRPENCHDVVAPTNSSYKRVFTLRENNIHRLPLDRVRLALLLLMLYELAAKNPVFSNQMGRMEPLVVTFAYLRVNKKEQVQ